MSAAKKANSWETFYFVCYMHMKEFTKWVSVNTLFRRDVAVVWTCTANPDKTFSLFSHWTFILFSPFQMICSIAQKASPLRFSASTSPPWRGTQPTSSEQSFELWGCQTQAPRGMNSGLSSTRCVKIQYPCPFTNIKGKALYAKTLLDSSLSRMHLT